MQPSNDNIPPFPYKKILDKLKKSCQHGIKENCLLLAIAYKYGKGKKRNINKAKKYFSKSCAMGLNDGCEDLNILNNN